MANARAKQNQVAAQPPTTEERRWPGYNGRLNFGWPVTGGLWSCACGWTGTSNRAIEWGPQCYECPACGRRDLVQYVEASVAVPAALARELGSARTTAAEARGKCDWWQDKYHRTKDELEEARELIQAFRSRTTIVELRDRADAFLNQSDVERRLSEAHRIAGHIHRLAHHPEEGT